MGDYADSINIYDYKYKKPVYYTNPLSTYTTNAIVKLILTAENFNFDLAKDDGTDFRLMTYKSGIGVLNMWIAYWSKVRKRATLFFKVPSVGGSVSVTFTAYWGNPVATNSSDPGSLGFLFYEDFNSTPLSSLKWTGDLNGAITSYGYYPGGNHICTSIAKPIEGKNSWVLEAGLYADFNTDAAWTESMYAIAFGFIGTENDFYVGPAHDRHIRTNAIESAQASSVSLYKDYGGLESYSYQEVYLDYYEPSDRITFKLQSRNTFPDVEYQIYRKVEGDTRPQKIKVMGHYVDWYLNGAYPCYISWLIVREYDGISIGHLDGRDLFIPYENVPHQNQDYRIFQPDFTSIQYEHTSSSGGNPYLLSDEGFDADSNVWVSDDGASLGEPALTIHIGWKEDVTSKSYIHYDSGHEYYYNASKLSDNSTDSMGRDHWRCTTTRGWAAIKFPSPISIGAFSIKATNANDNCPMDFTFYGSNFNPSLYFDRAVKLIDGVFENTTDWQSRVLTANLTYKYFILYIKNTHGGDNIQIKEWQMMRYLGQVKKKYPTQLRLCPALYSNWIYNFPKEISLQGSLDSINWTTIIPWTKTYTPFIQHYTGYGYWQRYSFDNVLGFWSFRLLCRGNWEAEDNRIIIGEWSLHELEEEAYTYRILEGTTNNIQQIFTTIECGLNTESGRIFISNDKMNIISNERIDHSLNLPEYYEDFNVI